MKNVITKMTIAAALVAAAGIASAQTMEVNIPFAFRAGGEVFAAGTYRVKVDNGPSGNTLVSIQNADRKQLAFALAHLNQEAKAAWKNSGTAVVSFQCGVSRCVLSDIYLGEGQSTYGLPRHSRTVRGLRVDNAVQIERGRGHVSLT